MFLKTLYDSWYLPTFAKLYHYVEKVFIPALTDGDIPKDMKRTILSLPGNFEGMVIAIFADIAKKNTKIQETSSNLW